MFCCKNIGIWYVLLTLLETTKQLVLFEEDHVHTLGIPNDSGDLFNKGEIHYFPDYKHNFDDYPNIQEYPFQRKERDMQEYDDYRNEKDSPNLSKGGLSLFSWWKNEPEAKRLKSGTYPPVSNEIANTDANTTVSANTGVSANTTDSANAVDSANTTASASTTGSASTAVSPNTTDSASAAVSANTTDSVSTAVSANTTDSASTAVSANTTDSASTAVSANTSDSANTAVSTNTTDSASTAVSVNTTDSTGSTVSTGTTTGANTSVQSAALSSDSNPDASTSTSGYLTTCFCYNVTEECSPFIIATAVTCLGEDSSTPTTSEITVPTTASSSNVSTVVSGMTTIASSENTTAAPTISGSTPALNTTSVASVSDTAAGQNTTGTQAMSGSTASLIITTGAQAMSGSTPALNTTASLVTSQNTISISNGTSTTLTGNGTSSDTISSLTSTSSGTDANTGTSMPTALNMLGAGVFLPVYEIPMTPYLVMATPQTTKKKKMFHRIDSYRDSQPTKLQLGNISNYDQMLLSENYINKNNINEIPYTTFEFKEDKPTYLSDQTKQVGIIVANRIAPTSNMLPRGQQVLRNNSFLLNKITIQNQENGGFRTAPNQIFVKPSEKYSNYHPLIDQNLPSSNHKSDELIQNQRTLELFHEPYNLSQTTLQVYNYPSPQSSVPSPNHKSDELIQNQRTLELFHEPYNLSQNTLQVYNYPSPQSSVPSPNHKSDELIQNQRTLELFHEPYNLSQNTLQVYNYPSPQSSVLAEPLKALPDIQKVNYTILKNIQTLENKEFPDIKNFRSEFAKYNDTYLFQNSNTSVNLVELCKNVTCQGSNYLSACCSRVFGKEKGPGEDFSFLQPIPGYFKTALNSTNKNPLINTPTNSRASTTVQGLHQLVDKNVTQSTTTKVETSTSGCNCNSKPKNIRVVRENDMNDFVRFQLMHGMTAPCGKEMMNALKEASLEIQKVNREFHSNGPGNIFKINGNGQNIHLPTIDNNLLSKKEPESVGVPLSSNKILDGLRATISNSLLQSNLKSSPFQKDRYRFIRNQGLKDQMESIRESNLILDKIKKETEMELQRLFLLENKRREEELLIDRKRENELKELKAVQDIIHREFESRIQGDSAKGDFSDTAHNQIKQYQIKKGSKYSKAEKNMDKSGENNNLDNLIFDKYSSVGGNTSHNFKQGSDLIDFEKFPELEINNSPNVPHDEALLFLNIGPDKERLSEEERERREGYHNAKNKILKENI